MFGSILGRRERAKVFCFLLSVGPKKFDVLAKGRRLIFYDPGNRGQSTAVELEQISFQNDVRDLDAIRKHFALEKMSLIGWSYFGGVVARYAMEFPQHIERFVMVCGPPIQRLPHSDTINRVMADRINARRAGVSPGATGNQLS